MLKRQIACKALAFASQGALTVNAALFAGVLGLAVPAAGPAEALPRSITCRITTYYQTAEMETEVGVRTTCPGGAKWGRTSPHRQVEVVTLDTPTGPTTGGGPGGLPCE